MRIVVSMLKASIVAAIVFAIARIHVPGFVESLHTSFRIFIGYGILIVLFAIFIGAPLAPVAQRYRLICSWFVTSIGVAVGAMLGGIFTYRESSQPVEIENPHALSFSRWNRNAPRAPFG